MNNLNCNEAPVTDITFGGGRRQPRWLTADEFIAELEPDIRAMFK